MGVTILIHLFHNQKRGMLMGTCCSISWETPSQVCLPTCLPAINFSRSGSLLGLEAHIVHKEYSGEFYCAQNVYNVHRTCLITNDKSYFFSRGNVVYISPYSLKYMMLNSVCTLSYNVHKEYSGEFSCAQDIYIVHKMNLQVRLF